MNVPITARTVLAGDGRLGLLPSLDVDATRQLDLGRLLLDAPQGSYLRVYRPQPTVAFTGRDRVATGFGRAVAAASAHGFTAAVRGPGGRAVAYHEDSLCVEIVVTGDGLDRAVEARFAAFAAVFVDAFATLGVQTDIAEVPGESCPGAHSVTVGGRRKLVGIAQRLTGRGWMLGAVVVVARPDPVRAVTADVYGELGVPFAPETVCAVDDLAPGATTADLASAVTARLRAEVDIAPADWPSAALTGLPGRSSA